MSNIYDWPCAVIDINSIPDNIRHEMFKSLTWMSNESMEFRSVMFDSPNHYYIFVKDPKHMILLKLKYGHVYSTTLSDSDRTKLFAPKFPTKGIRDVTRT